MLFGWFGGDGLEATTGNMEALELRPGRRHALAAGHAETVGGTLLAVGALTPVATTLLSSTMVTAIRKVHAPNGPWNTGVSSRSAAPAPEVAAPAPGSSGAVPTAVPVGSTS